MSNGSSTILLANLCEPAWIEGNPLPEGLSEHDFQRMVSAAHRVRQYRDDLFWHYEDYNVGFAGLGNPRGSDHLELVVARNRKHRAGECPHKMCAEHGAEVQALLHDMDEIRYGALFAPPNIDHAAGKIYDPVPWCGPCRRRNWDYRGRFKSNSWIVIGRPFEMNCPHPMMAWEFGPLTRALGAYSGQYWHAGE